MKEYLNSKVKVLNLKQIHDRRGWLMEVIRGNGSEHRAGSGPLSISKEDFGQVYVTTCRPGVIKAWHKHENQTDRITIVSGTARIVAMDSEKREFQEEIIGEFAPKLMIVAPGIWHGFTPVGDKDAVFVSVPDKVYNYKDPDEIRAPYNRATFTSIYDWNSEPHG